MALQLGFDGSVKLLDYSRESLLEAAQRGAQTYSTLARSIEPGESEKEVYWRIVFAILSVHSPIGATFAAYRQVRLVYALRSRLPGQRRLVSILAAARASDGVILYAGQKARFLSQFDADWRTDRTRFLRGDSDDNDWRLRLRANVLGLGLAKASFAVALCCPSTSDVCCIDTHIFQLLTGKPYRAIVSLLSLIHI